MAHGESINLSLCGKYITLLQENEKKKIGYWRVMYVILFAMGAEVLVSSPVCPVESMCMAVRVCIAGPLEF